MSPGLQPWSRDKRTNFQRKLLAWYDLHRRDLPWRASRDPYRVWLSEIMLQQTRVAAVIAHYHEFLRRFPNVKKLAAAREASVLAAWSGLGYYRRARKLHAAAKVIAREYCGNLPATAEALLLLPGIGRYTAAAIASIAFNEPIAVVDGNVERVLQRVSGKRLAGKELWAAANHLLEAKRPGDFNQAMMEMGATVCTPRSPTCLACPVIDLCATRGELTATAKPVRQKKREIHYALNCRDGEVLLVQRGRDESLMPGMWELPEFPAEERVPAERRVPFNELRTSSPPRFADRRNDRASGTVNKRGTNSGASFTLRHSITTTDYTVYVWRSATPSGVVGIWTPVKRLRKIALTGLARKILRTDEII